MLARGCWSEVRALRRAASEEPGALRARGEPHAFDVLRGSLKIGRVDWPLLGEHNQLNALAAIGAAEHVGVAPEAAAAALGALRERAAPHGAARRGRRRQGLRRLRAPPDGDPHHRRRPAPQRVGRWQRILAVFEPRSNTMKLGTMKAQLPWALEEADLAFCLQGDSAGTRARRWRRWATQARGRRQRRRAGRGRRRRGRAPRRPRAGDEQRRLRRHPRQAARQRWRAEADPAEASRVPSRTCCTCTASARRRSRSRRA